LVVRVVYIVGLFIQEGIPRATAWRPAVGRGGRVLSSRFRGWRLLARLHRSHALRCNIYGERRDRGATMVCLYFDSFKPNSNFEPVGFAMQTHALSKPTDPEPSLPNEVATCEASSGSGSPPPSCTGALRRWKGYHKHTNVPKQAITHFPIYKRIPTHAPISARTHSKTCFHDIWVSVFEPPLYVPIHAHLNVHLYTPTQICSHPQTRTTFVGLRRLNPQ